jgi:hypothetical protein
MTRQEIERIADEAIAQFIHIYWGAGASMTPGMASAVDQCHKDAIRISADVTQKRNETARRISYAKHGMSTPMPAGQPDMCPEEVRAMYE